MVGVSSDDLYWSFILMRSIERRSIDDMHFGMYDGSSNVQPYTEASSLNRQFRKVWLNGVDICGWCRGEFEGMCRWLSSPALAPLTAFQFTANSTSITPIIGMQLTSKFILLLRSGLAISGPTGTDTLHITKLRTQIVLYFTVACNKDLCANKK